jgi:DNA-binding Lrp family transcriptional regulator
MLAYVLVQISAKAQSDVVVNDIRQIGGVAQAHLTLGPTDCIAFIEVPDPAALGVCLGDIRAVKGVERTDTRLAFE